ncbi:MAG: DEAD/DEAH box helicase [Flavobacteriales bacterium]
MKFKDYAIHPAILQAIDELGYKRPTDIQFKVIPHILNGEDVMAVAPTGTGKTAAFAIPILHQIQRNTHRKGVQALVMVPTRELARQIESVFLGLSKHLSISVLSLIGGVEQDSQVKKLQERTQVLITTPGRMFDLIAQGYLDISTVQTWVLDEADLMLDLGFARDIVDAKRKLPKRLQTLFFTATINKKIKSLAYDVVKDAIRIQITKGNPVSKNVDHQVLMVEMDDKRFFLENILLEYPEERFMVFVRTKVRAERVQKAMERIGVASEMLHGGREQSERFNTLARFRSGENKVLITTDVACRGIDIPEVDYVINYDLPENPENYVHRCGRTGRGTRRGQALSFCSSSEITWLDAIEVYTGTEVERYDLAAHEYTEILKDHLDPDENWIKLMKDSDTENWD